MKSFAEFWPYYLDEHRHKSTRWLHFLGTNLALGLVASAVGFSEPWLAGAALLAGYGPAWLSHFLIEKNRPATFKHPLWSFAGDFRMWALTWSGRLDAEVARHLHSTDATG
jgi:hypothetical protein